MISPRSSLFVEAYLKANVTAIRPAGGIASEFGISERTLHRIFAGRDTSFERHVLKLRAELFHPLLAGGAASGTSIAELASQCGFADRRTPREPQGGLRPDAAGISQLDPYFPV